MRDRGENGKERRAVVGRAEMRRRDCSRKDWAVGRQGISAVD